MAVHLLFYVELALNKLCLQIKCCSKNITLEGNLEKK